MGLASYSKFILKQKLIKVGDYSILVVLTGSMEPTIKAGEMILIKEKDQYQVGDIVTYIDEDAYFITHRITQINGEECITQGDNNNLEDSKFNTNNIQGAVVFHSKVLGFFILYLLKPLAIIYLGSLLFVICNDKFFKDNKELNKEV